MARALRLRVACRLALLGMLACVSLGKASAAIVIAEVPHFAR